MSAENAWRIAMEAAAEWLSALHGRPGQNDAGAHDAAVREAQQVLHSLPMPPAFRAEVEAEAAKAFEAGVRAGWQSSNEGFNSEHWSGPQSEQQTEDGVVERAVLARALLSRLEAKGESHE